MKQMTLREEFLSEEDLSIAEMGDDELEAYWNFWLELAQATNDEDKDSYSHGVFAGSPVPGSQRGEEGGPSYRWKSLTIFCLFFTGVPPCSTSPVLPNSPAR